MEDAAFAFLRCTNGLLIRVETSYALNILPESQTGVRLMGDEAGATLFPLHIYTDEEGESVTLLQLPPADDKRSEKSLRHFIEACQGKDVMLATGREGWFIQSIVDRIYQAAEQSGGKTP